MGLLNVGAICPNCGGKLHTQARGLGALTWMRSGPLVKTGTQCQWCGTALTGKVGWDNRAVAAGTADAVASHAPSAREQAIEIAPERGGAKAEPRDPLAPPLKLPPDATEATRQLHEQWTAEDEEYVRDSERRAAQKLYGDPSY